MRKKKEISNEIKQNVISLTKQNVFSQKREILKMFNLNYYQLGLIFSEEGIEFKTTYKQKKDPERWRMISKMRGDGKTFGEIAKKLNISQQRVQQIAVAIGKDRRRKSDGYLLPSDDEIKTSGSGLSLDMTYQDMLLVLKAKYGVPADNYTAQKSYERFLKGENKYLSKKKITRTKEGLYIHHDMENLIPNLSNTYVIKELKPPYEMQCRENLTYCDALEHFLLHAKIMLDNKSSDFTNGYLMFLRPQLLVWFGDNKTPVLDWEKACKEKASEHDVINIVKDTDKLLLKEKVLTNVELDMGLASYKSLAKNDDE